VRLLLTTRAADGSVTSTENYLYTRTGSTEQRWAPIAPLSAAPDAAHGPDCLPLVGRPGTIPTMRTTRFALLSICATSLTLAACGAGPGAEQQTPPATEVVAAREQPKPAPAIRWIELCDAAAARAERCGEDWRSGSPGTCAGEERCMDNVLRPDARPALLACVKTAPCAPGAEILSVCAVAAQADVKLPQANRALGTECNAILASCGHAERCGPLPLLIDAIRDDLAECLRLGCEAANRCIEHTFDEHGCV
jgi:hypothetical protein